MLYTPSISLMTWMKLYRFHEDSLILSDNTKDLVARLLKNIQTTSRTNKAE